MQENWIYVILHFSVSSSNSFYARFFYKNCPWLITTHLSFFCLTSFVQQEHSEIHSCCLCITGSFLSGLGFYDMFIQQFVYLPIGGPLGYIWIGIITNKVGFDHSYLGHCRDFPISSAD